MKFLFSVEEFLAIRKTSPSRLDAQSIASSGLEDDLFQ